MGRMPPHAPISSASRRRLARWLVGSSLRDVERDLILETLSQSRGNRTEAARLLGVSVRTLRNKITESSAAGLDIPRHERAQRDPWRNSRGDFIGGITGYLDQT